MDILFILLPASLLLAVIALIAFLLSVRDGQMRDLDTPARRMLFEEEENSSEGEQ